MRIGSALKLRIWTCSDLAHCLVFLRDTLTLAVSKPTSQKGSKHPETVKSVETPSCKHLCGLRPRRQPLPREPLVGNSSSSSSDNRR
jgi:hypothetical protein